MQIFSTNLNNLSYTKFFQEITKLEKQNIVFTPNPEILLKTKTDKDFKNLLDQATFLTPDGIGLYIAFQILDANIPPLLKGVRGIYLTLLLPYYFFNLFFQRYSLYKKYGDRICGSDITKDLLAFAEVKKVKITILDLYNPEDANKVASQLIFEEKLQKAFPELSFDYIIYNPAKKEEIIDQIDTSESKILFSTLGMKAQEESIVQIMSKCEKIKLGLGVGSSFDYFIGFQKRAPKIFRSLGIEWFYRIFTGPQKLKRLKRIYNAIFVFTFEVIKSKK